MARPWVLLVVTIAIGCYQPAVPQPQPSTSKAATNVATFSKDGIDVTVTGVLDTDFGAWHDGNMWIRTTATISSWTPATTTSNGAVINGGQLNPNGITTTQGLDGRNPYTAPYLASVTSQNIPTMSVGDVLVIGRSALAPHYGNTTSDRTPGEWVYGNAQWQLLESVLTIHCVASIPNADAFRPPVNCDSIHRTGYCITQLLADSTFEDMVTSLPTDIDSTDPLFPDLDELSEHFLGFHGELREGWACEYTMPRWRSPGYGPSQTGIVSMALLVLCSDVAQPTKVTLAKRLVQRGLDYAGAWLNGNAIDDGHGYGRKSLIILAGKLLGMQNLEFIDRTLSHLSVPRFPEDNGGNFFLTIPTNSNFHWWHDATWTAGWRTGRYQGFSRWPEVDPDLENPPWYLDPPPFPARYAGTQISYEDHFTGHQLAFPPESWPRTHWDRPNERHDTLQRWALNGYFSDHHRCLLGTVLAMRLMDLTTQHGTALDRSMEQFMEGMSAADDALLDYELVNVGWGTGHSYAGGWDVALWNAQ